MGKLTNGKAPSTPFNRGRQLAVAKKAPVKKVSAKNKAVRPTKALSKRPVDMDARKAAAIGVRVKKFAMGVRRFAAKARKAVKAKKQTKKPTDQQRTQQRNAIRQAFAAKKTAPKQAI